MARDLPVRDLDGPAETTDSDEEPHATDRSERGTIDRRSYLKLAGVTAAVAGVGASAASASGEEYEVIQARGQTIRIDSGETWENKLIDFGNRNNITIVAYGTNWTIRNVGFRGTIPQNETIIGVADTGHGTSTVENVYFGESDGSQPSNLRSISIWVNPDHNGTLNVDRVNFNVPGNNGIYGSAPGYNGDGGDIHLTNCYGNDCHHTAFRIPDNGSSVRNSVSYKSGSRAANRSAWVWEGNYSGQATLEDCHFITNGQGGGLVTRGSPNLSVSNVRTDDGSGDANNPEHFIPEGCPESAEEAASGGNSSDDTPPIEDLPEHTLTVIGKGEATNYYFETTGEITENPERGTLESHDVIEDTSATGWVTTTENVDGFRFDGDLVDIGFYQGEATIEVNGEEVDPADYGEEDDSEPEYDHTLTFIGEGEPTNYYFETSGDIAGNDARGDLQDHDVIEDTSANGWVTTTEHIDGFRFDGDLLEVGFHQGAARVELDGEAIDPDEYSAEEDSLENLLLVDGVGTSGGTRYEFSVSGEVEKSTEQGASIDDEDVIDSGTVTGSVAGWRDAFRFSGDLEDLTVDGNARVYVNDEQVDPGDYGNEQPHVLTIVGNGTPSSYEVSVDGSIDLAVGEDDDSVTVSETTVEGSIERGVQRFRFSGTVSDITFIDGSAHVYVDDERVDPDEIGDAELLPHAIVFDATEADGESSYSFEIDGDVIASNYRDATADDGDVIEGTSVTGSLEDGLDAYWFDGDITDFRLNGDAAVDVEYNVRSQ